MVGGEQAIERQETCEQRAEPEDRGSKPRQQREVRSDRKRHQHHDCEKEKHANQGAATDAKRNPDIASDQGGKRAHKPSPTRRVRAVTPSGVWVAAMISPPRERCSDITPANSFCPSVSSALVGSSSSQTGRCTVSKRAIDSRRRWPAD